MLHHRYGSETIIPITEHRSNLLADDVTRVRVHVRRVSPTRCVAEVRLPGVPSHDVRGEERSDGQLTIRAPEHMWSVYARQPQWFQAVRHDIEGAWSGALA